MEWTSVFLFWPNFNFMYSFGFRVEYWSHSLLLRSLPMPSGNGMSSSREFVVVLMPAMMLPTQKENLEIQ